MEIGSGNFLVKLHSELPMVNLKVSDIRLFLFHSVSAFQRSTAFELLSVSQFHGFSRLFTAFELFGVLVFGFRCFFELSHDQELPMDNVLVFENVFMFAGFFSSLFAGFKMAAAALVGVCATAVLLAAGAPILLALGVGVLSGGLVYFALSRNVPEERPLPPKPPITEVTQVDLETAFYFTPSKILPGSNGCTPAKPFCCEIREVESVTSQTTSFVPRKRKYLEEISSCVNKSTRKQQIVTDQGREFQREFQKYLIQLRSRVGKDSKCTLHSLQVHCIPYPGESTLEMMRNTCNDIFPGICYQEIDENEGAAQQ